MVVENAMKLSFLKCNQVLQYGLSRINMTNLSVSIKPSNACFPFLKHKHTSEVALDT